MQSSTSSTSSVESTDKTKCSVFALEMLYQTFSWCLFFFIFLPSVLYLVTEQHALLGWDQKNIQFLCFLVLGCFCTMLWVIVHLYSEALFDQFCIWLNLIREYSHGHFTIHPTASNISHIHNKHQWHSSTMHAHAITLSLPCLTDDVIIFRSLAVSLLLYTSEFWYEFSDFF